MQSTRDDTFRYFSLEKTDEGVRARAAGSYLEITPNPIERQYTDLYDRTIEKQLQAVDLIYQGLLRYGRPAPDYSRSDASNVVLRFPKADADLPFLELILEEERRTGSPMPVDTLIALAQLRTAARLDILALSHALQRDEAETRALLGRLMGAGLVQAHGPARNREYSLSAAVYRRLGRAADYVRQAAFDDIQQEQMVLQYVQQHGRIMRKDAAELCRLSPDQAKRLLRRLVDEGKLAGHGARRTAYYTRT